MSQKYLIVITGVDGAGKTTQAILLKRTIGSRYGFNVELVHFEPPAPLSKLMGILLSKMGKKGSNSTATRSEKSYSRGYREASYSLLYLFIGIFFYFRLLYNLTVKGKGREHLIICDRYPLTDGLAHIMYRTQNLKFINYVLRIWNVFDLILNKISNQVFIHLFIDPLVAIIRRPEHDKKRLEIHQHIILYLCHKYKRHKCIVLNANKSLLDLHRNLLRLVDLFLR